MLRGGPPPKAALRPRSAVPRGAAPPVPEAKPIASLLASYASNCQPHENIPQPLPHLVTPFPHHGVAWLQGETVKLRAELAAERQLRHQRMTEDMSVAREHALVNELRDRDVALAKARESLRGLQAKLEARNVEAGAAEAALRAMLERQMCESSNARASEATLRATLDRQLVNTRAGEEALRAELDTASKLSALRSEGSGGDGLKRQADDVRPFPHRQRATAESGEVASEEQLLRLEVARLREASLCAEERREVARTAQVTLLDGTPAVAATEPGQPMQGLTGSTSGGTAVQELGSGTSGVSGSATVAETSLVSAVDAQLKAALERVATLEASLMAAEARARAAEVRSSEAEAASAKSDQWREEADRRLQQALGERDVAREQAESFAAFAPGMLREHASALEERLRLGRVHRVALGKLEAG